MENDKKWYSKNLAALFKREETLVDSEDTGKRKRGYNAAKVDNNNAYWTTTRTTNNSELVKDYQALVSRSRDLFRNSPFVKKYVEMSKSNIVGDKGFSVQSEVFDFLTSTVNGIKTTKKVNDTIAQDIIETGYEDWCKKENCDYSEKNSFKELCDIMIQSLRIDGEIFVVYHREKAGKNSKYGFKIELLDAQRIDYLYNDNLKNGNYIRNGIEFNSRGVEVAYHLRRPSKQTDLIADNYFSGNRIRLSTDQAKLLSRQEFAGQIRGTPHILAAIQYIKELDDFNKTVMFAAKTGAASSIYLERQESVNPEDVVDYDEDLDKYTTTMSPGQIRILPPGVQMKSFNGQYPSALYKDYVKQMVQIISSALNVSPLFLANTTEDVNYSNSRTILVEERENWKREQQFMIVNIISPIFEEWLSNALLNSTLKLATGQDLPFSKYEKFKKHTFYGRTWQWIDPAKDADAMINLIDNNLTTHTQVLANQGIDFEDIMKIKEQEREIMKKYGIEIVSKDAPIAPKTPDENLDENGKPKKE